MQVRSLQKKVLGSLTLELQTVAKSANVRGNTGDVRIQRADGRARCFLVHTWGGVQRGLSWRSDSWVTKGRLAGVVGLAFFVVFWIFLLLFLL